MAKALKEQKSLPDANSAEAVKVAFTEGFKQGSDLQTQPLHSSAIETETVCQSPIRSSEGYGLNAVHLLRPMTDIAITPSAVNYAMTVQQAVNLPVFSTNNGVIDCNKTFLPMGSFYTGKRYKRETNLKFSEGSVELYEDFTSQFNIHHIMFGWDTHRAEIELYMSLESKATLKVEEVVMNANGTSNVTEMWDALGLAFLPIDH